MYFVDREKIEKTLVCLEDLLTLFNNHSKWDSIIEKKALERIVHISIEAILDVGNDMIDGFIMRDPGSYEDIIDILEDEKVVISEHAIRLKNIVKLRKDIVQDYLEINHNEISLAMTENIAAINLFSTSVRTYLENELGPVSAFKK
ncbi:DUF86 domain-containing protein [Cytobacillus sp. S13-E01]|uniref:DUF86 domain-containing protein n=1 Tax=Cytobacillus sp. S13-E01 TaxID=3031326 RepID=UPI0023D812D0|nr:DUF86 domain-containing protein [Cytobacillus sp. S13-E01]MDF0727436.1 DUF86 domain-containing protein [Cytobacillus sp. S13-E01]